MLTSTTPTTLTVTQAYSKLHDTIHEIDDGDADDFFSSLVTGANLETSSPILTLRNRLMRVREQRLNLPERDLVAFFVIAWNAWRDGRSMTKLQRPQGTSWNPHTYPVPH